MDFALIILLSVLPILVIAAGLNDLTTMTIPNWISLGLMIGFVPTAFALGLPLSTIAVHFGVALGALFIGAGMFALRWLGGGDAKLIAAVCLWLGLSGSATFLLGTAGVGGGGFLGLGLGRGTPGPGTAARACRGARLGWLCSPGRPGCRVCSNRPATFRMGSPSRPAP